MEEWLNVIRKDSLDWIHVSDLNHWESEAIIPYGLDNIPANFLVDTKGKIIAKDLYGKKLSQKLQEIFN